MRHKGLVAVSLCMLGLAGCHNIRTARDPQDQVLQARNLLHGSGSSSVNGRLIFANALGFNITILSVQFRPDDVFSVTRRGWGSGGGGAYTGGKQLLPATTSIRCFSPVDEVFFSIQPLRVLPNLMPTKLNTAY